MGIPDVRSENTWQRLLAFNNTGKLVYRFVGINLN